MALESSNGGSKLSSGIPLLCDFLYPLPGPQLKPWNISSYFQELLEKLKEKLQVKHYPGVMMLHAGATIMWF